MRMRGLKLPMGIVMSLILMVMAGCGGSANSTGAAAQKQPEAQTAATTTPEKKADVPLVATKVAPGPDGSIVFMQAFVAEGLGSYKKNGLDVTMMPTDGGSNAFKALMSGEADFALLASDHAIKNRASGADLVIVGYLTRYPGLVFVVKKDLEGKVKSLADLKGKRVGVSSIGGGTHGATLALLEKLGMKQDDVEVIATKDKLVDMWDKGEIVAAMHSSPFTDQLVQDGKAFILYDLRTKKDTNFLYDSDYPLGVVVTRQDVIEKKPELVQKMLQSIMDANNFIKTATPEQILGKLPERMTKTMDAKLYTTVIKANLEGLTLDAKVQQKDLETVIASMRKLKLIPAEAQIDASKLVNLSFVDKTK